MVRHREMRILTDEEVVRSDRHGLAAELCHFFEESEGVNHHAISDDAKFIRPDNATRNKVQDILLPVTDDGVARIAAALCPHHYVTALREVVHDFALAFVSPLETDDDGVR